MRDRNTVVRHGTVQGRAAVRHRMLVVCTAVRRDAVSVTVPHVVCLVDLMRLQTVSFIPLMARVGVTVRALGGLVGGERITLGMVMMRVGRECGAATNFLGDLVARGATVDAVPVADQLRDC